MAFVTTYERPGEAESIAYNIDYAVGCGAPCNMRTDILLVQYLLHIVHYELYDPVPPPQGEKEIVVDGILGPSTLRYIMNAQRAAKAAGRNVLIDGKFDPFRSERGALSKFARVNYSFEALNDACYNRCKKEGSRAYTDLVHRDDLPSPLAAELRGTWRKVAKQYQRWG